MNLPPAPLAPPRSITEVLFAFAVLALQGSGLVRCFDKANTPVYYIPRGKQLAAAYYRNTITHYFLSAALAEIGLAACARDIESPNAQLLEREVLGLRDLYRFEFFFKPTAEFLQEVQAADSCASMLFEATNE